jgi:hypothetical protein
MSAISRVAPRIGGVGFDLRMAVLGTIFVSGLFLDGWAHTHGRVDQSFFTPWHAVLYSGFALNFLVLAGTVGLNRSRGYAWREAIPSGYALSLLGLGLWFIGGPGDLLWHTLFGIEENVDALYSPTHLLLASGLVLAVTGPFRAAWVRKNVSVSLAEQLPLALSLAACLATLTFFIQYTHPLVNFWGIRPDSVNDTMQAFGASSLLLISGVWMGVLLLAIRRWRLGPGVITLTLGANAVAMAFLGWSIYPLPLVVALVVASALVDGLYQGLKPGPYRARALRLFSFLAPVILVGAYFLVGGLARAIYWSVHLTSGILLLTGVVGLFLSLLVAPPFSAADD